MTAATKQQQQKQTNKKQLHDMELHVVELFTSIASLSLVRLDNIAE